MKQLASVIVIVLITIAAILIAWQLRTIVFLFLFSVLIAATVRGPTDHLIRRQWPRWAALTIVYSVVFLILIGLTVMVIIPLANEAESLVTTLVRNYEIGYGIVQSDRFAANRFATRLPSAELVSQFLLGDQENNLASHLLAFGQTFAWWMGQIFLALVVSVYWSADEWHFERLWLSLLPPAQRMRMRDLWRTMELGVGAYLRSEVMQSIVAGAFFTLAFALFGFDHPFTMATIGALFWFIPVAGALLAVLSIGALALLNGTWLTMTIAVLLTIAIYSFLEFFVEPRLYDRSDYGTLPVLVTMMIMVELYGLIGLIMAPPVALALQMAFDEWVHTPNETTDAKTLRLRDIAEQFKALQRTLTNHESSSPYIVNITERLEELLQETAEAEKISARKLRMQWTPKP